MTEYNKNTSLTKYMAAAAKCEAFKNAARWGQKIVSDLIANIKKKVKYKTFDAKERPSKSREGSCSKHGVYLYCVLQSIGERSGGAYDVISSHRWEEEIIHSKSGLY